MKEVNKITNIDLAVCKLLICCWVVNTEFEPELLFKN